MWVFNISLSLAFSLAGVEQIYKLGDLSDYEAAGLKALIPELRDSIDKGITYATQ
jgi:malate dehydrogenase